MVRIVNYMVIEKYSSTDLQSAVMGQICLGWQPYGDMVTLITGDNKTSGTTYSVNTCAFIQPMVQYEQLYNNQLENKTIDTNVLIDFLENYGK